MFKAPKADWDPDDEGEVGQRLVKSAGRIRTSLEWESNGKVLEAGAFISALHLVIRSMTSNVLGDSLNYEQKIWLPFSKRPITSEV